MITIDEKAAVVIVEDGDKKVSYPFASPEAFNIVSDAWLRVGWDCKHVYSFTWFGRPIIQLPEDMVRIQEVIYKVKPDVIIETGIAHGGSLIYYASLCKAMGKGRVIGVDIEIRPHNRKAIEEHSLFSYITLIEGSSIEPAIVDQVKSLVKPGETVMIMLDARHLKDHVEKELEMYSPMVSVGSYIVAMDGIMGKLGDNAPRTGDDWKWNNPAEAAKAFVATHPDYVIEQPEFAFNEGLVKDPVTYWPSSYIKRLR